jgi:hypothetical protein
MGHDSADAAKRRDKPRVGESRVLKRIFGYGIQVLRCAIHALASVGTRSARMVMWAGDGPLFGAGSWMHSPPPATLLR